MVESQTDNSSILLPVLGPKPRPARRHLYSRRVKTDFKTLPRPIGYEGIWADTFVHKDKVEYPTPTLTFGVAGLNRTQDKFHEVCKSILSEQTDNGYCFKIGKVVKLGAKLLSTVEVELDHLHHEIRAADIILKFKQRGFASFLIQSRKRFPPVSDPPSPSTSPPSLRDSFSNQQTADRSSPNHPPLPLSPLSLPHPMSPHVQPIIPPSDPIPSPYPPPFSNSIDSHLSNTFPSFSSSPNLQSNPSNCFPPQPFITDIQHPSHLPHPPSSSNSLHPPQKRGSPPRPSPKTIRRSKPLPHPNHVKLPELKKSNLRSISFLSFNCYSLETSVDDIKRLQVQECIERKQPTIFILQETRLNDELTNLRWDGYTVIVKSPEEFGDGNSCGGLIIGLRKDANLYLQEVKTPFDRLQLVEIIGTEAESKTTYRLLVGNFYGPAHHTAENTALRKKLLFAAAKSFQDKIYPYDGVIFGGDFNAGRELLGKEMQETSLRLTRVPIPGITHPAKGNARASTIDHWCVNNKLVPNIDPTSFYNEEWPVSDHNAIGFSLRIPKLDPGPPRYVIETDPTTLARNFQEMNRM